MKLYIFVEGKNDIDFFEKILNSEIKKRFDDFECIPYVENMNKERDVILRLIKNKNSYIFCPDLDAKFSENKVNSRKKEIAENFIKIDFDTVKDQMYIIIQKIESWYLAGFDRKFHAEEITKGTFLKIAEIKRQDVNSIRNMLISNKGKYSINVACKRNKSFEKFYNAVIK